MNFFKAHPIFCVFCALILVGLPALFAVAWAWAAWHEAIQQAMADQLYFSVFLAVVVFGVIMGAVAYCILLERKISAWIQDRYGPNRVGPCGLLQPIADGLKFLLKEDIIPANVDKALFLLAPWMIFVVALIGFAIIPWGGEFRWPWMADDAEPLTAQVSSIDIGLLYLLAVSSLGVYGVVLGGWSSNNKYSFYGGMRAAAQMLSYEIPMGLCILVAILMSGQLRLEGIVAAQSAELLGVSALNWNVCYYPLAALILFITALAEANRMPFDLAESEQELVGGYHTEYSAMKLALFFLAEYAHMITASAFMVALFFGGYLIPGWTWLNEDTGVAAMLCRMAVTAAKIFGFIVLMMVVRWTLPRFRFDQLMRLGWKWLVPISMILVAAQTVIIYADWPRWPAALAANVLIFLAAGFFAAARDGKITGRQSSLRRRTGVSVQRA